MLGDIVERGNTTPVKENITCGFDVNICRGKLGA
jgi:hypothetical protein